MSQVSTLYLRKKSNPLYSCWYNMMQRCYNPQRKDYRSYGGRGINVCERWHTFEYFCDDMGKAPEGHRIERLNNDAPYSLENCIWVLPSVQARNRRSNTFLTYNGKTQCVQDWVQETGVGYRDIFARIKKGYPPEWIFFAGGQIGRLITYNGVTKRMQDWAKESGIPLKAFRARLQQGWTMERAMTEPLNIAYRLHKKTAS